MDLVPTGVHLPPWLAYPVIIFGSLVIVAGIGFRIYYRMIGPPPRRRRN
jgi:hypothetical protein